MLVPRPRCPVEHRHEERQVMFDGPVSHGLSARSDPARPAGQDEAVPIPLGQGLGLPVPPEAPEKHLHRGPVLQPRPVSLGGYHLFVVDFKKPSQGERLGLGFRLASGLVDRQASGNLIRLPFGASPIAVLQRSREPAPVLAPLYLVDAGFRIREDPDPVPAPFASAVAAPTSFRACHHSIPPMMNRCSAAVMPEPTRRRGRPAPSTVVIRP